MAGTKISALTSLSVVSDSVIIPVVDGGINYKTSATALKTYIGTYGDSNVAAYLTAQSIGSYGDGNVAAYLSGHPQAGTYTDSNVASYLSTHLQAGTYTNANVAAYLPTFGGNVLSSNIVQTAAGQITTPSGTNGNITLNPDGTGWVVVTSITPAWFGNTVTMTNALTVKDVRDTVYDLGTTGGTIAPNGANGDVQTITLSSALTLNAFTNPVSGQTITLIINQGTGGFALTSNMKFAGGYKTLSTAANATDILHISYIGSTYYASLVTGYV